MHIDWRQRLRLRRREHGRRRADGDAVGALEEREVDLAHELLRVDLVRRDREAVWWWCVMLAIHAASNKQYFILTRLPQKAGSSELFNYVMVMVM